MSAPSMAARTCEAWFVLEAAELRGLPAPYVVRVTSHSVTDLVVKTLDEFNTWAEALHAEPTSHEFGGTLHMTASGSLYDDEDAFVVMVSTVVTADEWVAS